LATRGANYQKILEKYFPGTRVMSRSGSVSLGRPFKAGTNGEFHDSVASATNDSSQSQSSLTRRVGWYADVFPALNGRATFISRYAAMSGSATGYLTISSDHFRLTYPSDVERRDADQVLKTLESARSDYLRRASAAVSVEIPILQIRLNESSGDFTGRTGQPWWAAAATKGNRIELQPLRILKQRSVLFSTLRHELAHVLIDSISHNHSPRWLAEGFAIYLAGEGEMISRYLKRGLLSDEELEKRLEQPSSQDEMRSLYAQAYISVAGHVRSEGEASVWRRLAGS